MFGGENRHRSVKQLLAVRIAVAELRWPVLHHDYVVFKTILLANLSSGRPDAFQRLKLSVVNVF